MKKKHVVIGMTGASPVTTIPTITAWQSHATPLYSSDRACPCHVPHGSICNDKLSNSYLDAYERNELLPLPLLFEGAAHDALHVAHISDAEKLSCIC